MKIKGKVYRIIGDDKATGKTLVYIGSTTQELHERLSSHKTHLTAHKNNKHGDVGSFRIISQDWYEICLEEEIEFDNYTQLLEAERKAYEKYSADSENYIVTNINVPARSAAEYFSSPIGRASLKRYHQSEKGKQALKRANKKYYEAHKDEKKQQMKERYHQQKANALKDTNAAPVNDDQPPTPDTPPEN